MNNITAKQIAEFRAKTGLPMMECKKALVEANGNEEKALMLLKKKGIKKAQSKAERETRSGLIESYVHNGQIGVLVEVLAETDFVAKNEQFKEFVHNVALQIAASNPKYIKKEDIESVELEKIKSELKESSDLENKPEEIVNKIIEGRLQKYFSEVCLLDQPFVKSEDQNISDLLNELIAKIGENIVISRFCRFELGK